MKEAAISASVESCEWNCNFTGPCGATRCGKPVKMLNKHFTLSALKADSVSTTVDIIPYANLPNERAFMPLSNQHEGKFGSVLSDRSERAD